MILIAKEDAAALRAALPERALMTLHAERSPGTRGANAVGFLPGEADGAPIVIGAHHDGWFRAAFDNASGVAAMLAIARALTAAGHRPRHPLCFTSRTAEEYGLEDSPFDWCIGAWRQVQDTHPEWGARSPFHLCVEASGHPDLRLLVEAPAELAGWVRDAARIAPPRGLAPLELADRAARHRHGAVAAARVRHPRHQRAHVGEVLHAHRLPHAARHAGAARLRPSRAPDPLLRLSAAARRRRSRRDPRPRRADRRRGAGGHEARRHRGRRLATAARRRGATAGAAFTTVGRELLAVDAHGALAYPHAQAAKDAEQLEAALAALGGSDRRGAAKALRAVGANALAPKLSQAAFARHAARLEPGGCGTSWAQASHLTASPDLWAEIASLSGRKGAAAPGPWIEQSLKRHLEQARAEVARRVEAMAGALEAVVP